MRRLLLISILVQLAAAPWTAIAQEADTVSINRSVALPDSYRLRPFGGIIVSTDSLLRWQQWSGFAEWASRQPGSIAKELGGYGRNAAIRTATPAVNADRIRWMGVVLNNPITGQYNPAEIPIDQSAQVTHFNRGFSEFAIDPLVYHVVKPLTVIRYEQSSYEYRNLDGLLVLPASERLMVQASYQGQKDDGKYARSNFEGRRSTGNIRYHLNSDWSADAFWLYQGAEMQESMGYLFDDPSQFEFDRFRAQAISGNSASMRRLFLTGLSLERSGNSTRQTITLYRKLHRHEWRTTDTTYIRAQEWGISVLNDLSVVEQLHTQAYFDATVASKKNGDAIRLDRSPDVLFNLGFRLEYDVGKRMAFGSHSELSKNITRDVSFLDLYVRYNLSESANLNLGRSIRDDDPRSEGTGFTSRGYAPILYASDMDGSRWYARVNDMAGLWRYDVGVHYSESITVPVIIGDVIRPTTINDHVVASGLVERNGDRSELSVGYVASDLFDENVEQRFQVAGYLKGYAFDRAAYLKGGAVYYASLNGRSSTYLPEFGLWTHGNALGGVPDHHRLDIEFAARVRSMILSGRLENTLDGWTQKGYFQTLPYPMPGRRFRVGLKVHFRD